MTSIIIPHSVTSIGNQAFYTCTALTSITIPALVTSIGWGVFSYCNSLASINVNQSNANYSSVDGILYDELIHTLISYPHGKSGSIFIIPDSVKTIGKSAFNGCTGLTSITIPASVTSIDDNAFMNCASLTSITIPALVTSIGTDTFQGCTVLATATFLGDVPMLGDRAFGGISPGAKAYYILNTADRNLAQYFLGGVTQMVFTYTVLSGSATITGFTSKTYTGSLVIPSILGGAPVTAIGTNAFKDYTGLTSINIPASITDINAGAFINCTSLETVTFASGSQLLIIGIAAFEGCTSLKSITIPSSVISINNNAFFTCSSLTSIISPASVTSIGNGAFQNATSLKTMTFVSGSKLTFIGNHAFQNATSLTSITIPALVEIIEEAVFLNSGLITMYVSTTNKLGLTPGTSVTRYGKTFTVKDVASAVAPTIPICFLAGTKVTTDQGNIDIEKLNPKIHTIRGKKIVSITKSTPLQKIFYNGKMVSAIDLIEVFQGATANNGKIIYIVLLKSIRR